MRFPAHKAISLRICMGNRMHKCSRFLGSVHLSPRTVRIWRLKSEIIIGLLFLLFSSFSCGTKEDSQRKAKGI